MSYYTSTSSNGLASTSASTSSGFASSSPYAASSPFAYSFTSASASSPSGSSNADVADTLVMAHVLFRHGARNIVAPYPTDPYKDEVHWPEGYGQLINEGKRQLYRLGQYMRRRYRNLLDMKYSYRDVYCQSTDFDRTIMSAQCCLAGLYPPSDDEKFTEDVNWQPIPVHTIPAPLDYVLTTGKQCPRFLLAHVRYLQEAPQMTSVFTEYRNYLQYWSMNTGMNVDRLDVVNLLYNTLCIEKEQNKPLPEWAERALEPDSPMSYIANLHFQSYANTIELARLKPGFLIKEIMMRFAQKIGNVLQPDRKLWLYSAHDLTIVNVLNALGLYQMHFPPYGASLHFELYRTCEGEHYIQIYYRHVEEEFPEAMIIPGCGVKCTLSQFYAVYHQIIPSDDFEAECRHRV